MFRKNTSFWVFLQVHSVLNYSPELKLKSFHFQGNHNWAWKKSCRLVAIPCNSNLKSFAYEYLCRSVPRSCPTLCDPTDCSTPGLPVLYHLPEFAQTHVHWVGDAIQPSHPLFFPSPPAFNRSQYQGLICFTGSSHQVAEVLEHQLQLQLQSFQWIFRVDLF